jgi:hypothetical protein
MTPKTVLSFPYEGGMYYLLNQHIDWVPHAALDSDGYYPVLFGSQAQLMKSKATALGALFEEIILVGADAFLPDRENSTTDDNYWHPDFRIRVPNSHYAEWDEDNRALAEQLLQSPIIINEFRTRYYHLLKEHDRLQMLCRLLLQMHAAQTYDAVVVGDANLCALHNSILKVLTATSQQQSEAFQSESLAIDSHTSSIVGLEFHCADMDAFAAVRQSKEIRIYAEQFRNAISTARSENASDLTRQLLLLMKEARETNGIANKIAGGFETGSSIIGVAGLIPFVGSVTGLVGLGTDAAARAARHAQSKREWYAIGAHMQRVALDDLLSRV